MSSLKKLRPTTFKFLFLGGFISVLSFSQTPPPAVGTLELKDAVGEALEHSPRIEKYESLTNQAGWNKTEAYSGFLPQLSVNSFYLTNKKYILTDINFGGSPTSVPGIIPTTQVSLLAELPLFDGFASTQRLRSAWATEDAAQNDEVWARFQIQREVTLQFFRSLGAQALYDVATQNLKTISDHLKDVNLFKKAGMSTNFDVLRVEVQVSEAKSELMNSEDNLVSEKNKLSELLGHEQEFRDLKGELPVLQSTIVGEKTLKSDGGRKDLQALESRVQAATFRSSAANKFWLPRLSLFGEYDYYNNRNDRAFDRDAFRNAYHAGISLKWNIFDVGTFARSREDIETRVQGEKDLQISRLRAARDLDFWRRKFTYFCSIYQARVSDVQKSSESVRLAKEANRAGTRTNTDLLDAETELFRARAGAVNAQLGSIEALVNLELASGTQLYDFK